MRFNRRALECSYARASSSHHDARLHTNASLPRKCGAIAPRVAPDVVRRRRCQEELRLRACRLPGVHCRHYKICGTCRFTHRQSSRTPARGMRVPVCNHAPFGFRCSKPSSASTASKPRSSTSAGRERCCACPSPSRSAQTRASRCRSVRRRLKLTGRWCGRGVVNPRHSSQANATSASASAHRRHMK